MREWGCSSGTVAAQPRRTASQVSLEVPELALSTPTDLDEGAVAFAFGPKVSDGEHRRAPPEANSLTQRSRG